MNPPVPFVAVAAALVLAAGCTTTIALDRAVIAYDTTATDSISRQLLLNIARARHDEPIHFTGISNIAATWNFSINAGISGALTGENGNLIIPIAGIGAEENPTVSIEPMDGEEFTQRLLTPFREQKLTLLLRQGYDVDSLLRLLGAELTVRDGRTGALVVHYNRPSDTTGYPLFRRFVAHLSSIQDRHALFVEPLHFQHEWTVPAREVTPESIDGTYAGFTLRKDDEHDVVHVSRRVNGRVMITNFDPAVLPNDERVRLHAEADEVPDNDILVDIRAGFPGGEIPYRGRLRLRSFHEILTFLGRGIAEEPEYDVPADPRSGSLRENPARTMDVVEASRAPRGAGLSVRLHGRTYALRPETGYQWNRKAFSVLYQLFQMSVAGVEKNGPEITIAK